MVDVYLVAKQGWHSVRAFASHQCSLGLIQLISGLSLLVLYSAPRGFSPGTPVFLSPLKPTFHLSYLISRKYCKAHLIICTC